MIHDLDLETRDRYLDLLVDRFQIPKETFACYRFVATSSKYFSILSAEHETPTEVQLTGTGMVFMRTNTPYPKLTTGAAMMFGHLARINTVEVSTTQAVWFLSRRIFRLDPSHTMVCTGFGYVIVRCEGVTLGMGLYKPDGISGELFSLYPRALALK